MKLDVKSRYLVVKSILSKEVYFLWFAAFLASYIVLNVWLNDALDVLPFLRQYRQAIIVPFLALSTLNAILVALNLTVILYTIKQVSLGIGANAGQKGLTAAGIMGGLLGGACPGCFVGLLPALAGVFGLTIAVGSLPLLGFEIQVPTFIILVVSLYIIAKPMTCRIDVEKK